MANLSKYVGRNFGYCFFEICDYLNIPNNPDNELYLVMDEFEKQGLRADNRDWIIKRK